MRRGRMIVSIGAAAAVYAAASLVAAWWQASPAPAAEVSCPNEARRAEQSSVYLSSCRAYEQVTPVTKDSGEPQAVVIGLLERHPFEPVRGAIAAVDGDRMAWISEYPGLSGEASLGLSYLSARGSGGWRTEATVPPQSPETGVACPEDPGMVAWSSELTAGILADGAEQEFGTGLEGEVFHNQNAGCGHDEPRLVEGEPEGFQNLFRYGSETGSYQLVNVTPPAAPHPTPRGGGEQVYFQPNFLAGSADLGLVVFEDELPLVEEAEHLTKQGEALGELEAACGESPKGRACWEGHDDLYVWSEGRRPAVRLVSILPSGEPVEGSLAGSTRNATPVGATSLPLNIADHRGGVSANGARIFFEAEGNLYVRENGAQPQSALGPTGECTEPAMACTIELDLPQAGAPGPGGGGKWLGANADGTEALFTDEASAGLTASTQAGSGANLYEYELPSEANRTGTLVDLTPDAEAEVLGLSGMGENGSYAYFVADGALVGSGQNSQGAAAQPGQPNLYAAHDGAVTFIATLSPEDLCDWTSDTGCNLPEPTNPSETGLTARVSANGRYLAFNSVNELTGYANAGPLCAPIFEGGGFRGYGPGSCEEIFLYEAEGNRLACVSCNPKGAPSANGAAIDWPATADRDGSILRNAYPQRNVSDAGEVFFETAEALSQPDTNGQPDVYEYEAAKLHLISSGTSEAPSYFLDASASGDDVFFATAQKLLPRDGDSAYDIYDARVGGGFPEPIPPPSCEGEACGHAAPAPGLFSLPASATIAGAGNLVPAVKPSAKPKAPKRKHARKRCGRRHKRSPRCKKQRERARRKGAR